MARRSSRRRDRETSSNNGSEQPEAAPRRSARVSSERGKMVEAFMELLAERPFGEIGFADIAARAGVSLAELRREFGSRFELLSAHMKEIDREVIEGGEADMAEEPARERLFEVLMRRFEALAPYKEALRSLINSAYTDPMLACALNALAVRSLQWMLAAANISPSGSLRLLRAQGLACLYASILPTFVAEDDPAHPRTMAALDRALSRGEWWVGTLDTLCRWAPRFGPRRSRWRPWRDERGEESVAV